MSKVIQNISRVIGYCLMTTVIINCYVSLVLYIWS
jgi:hypothetical protein